MKKLLLAALFVLAVSAVWAQTATVMEVSGKVEVQAPGKAWKPARVGDVIVQGSLVSTGFKSTTVLQIGKATVTVKPITRLSLEQIVASETGSQTQLFLMAGRVKADVTPTAGSTTSFEVKSPTATASVRGTSFEFDGMNLIVDRGRVALSAPTGQLRSVGAGQFSTVASSGSVSQPAAVNTGAGLSQIETLLDTAAQDNATGSGLGSSLIPIPVTLTLVIQ